MGTSETGGCEWNETNEQENDNEERDAKCPDSHWPFCHDEPFPPQVNVFESMPAYA